MAVIEKLIRDDRVAVLYSPGYGAGWSTWADPIEDPDLPRRMLFDPQIADIVDRRDADWLEKVQAVATMKYPGVYLGGADDLRVKWLPVGTLFRVNEFDGNEELEIKEKMDWIIA
jgi:hypothetical protein